MVATSGSDRSDDSNAISEDRKTKLRHVIYLLNTIAILLLIIHATIPATDRLWLWSATIESIFNVIFFGLCLLIPGYTMLYNDISHIGIKFIWGEFVLLFLVLFISLVFTILTLD
jgi:hypothetical protein